MARHRRVAVHAGSERRHQQLALRRSVVSGQNVRRIVWRRETMVQAVGFARERKFIRAIEFDERLAQRPFVQSCQRPIPIGEPGLGVRTSIRKNPFLDRLGEIATRDRAQILARNVGA